MASLHVAKSPHLSRLGFLQKPFVSRYSLSVIRYCFATKATKDQASYRTLIDLITKHGNRHDREAVHSIIEEMKHQFDHRSFSHQEWWSIINHYRVCGDVDHMLDEYHSMLSVGAKSTKYILSSLLEGLIKGGQPHHVESIWNGLLQSFTLSELHPMFNSRVVQSIIVCVDQAGDRLPVSLLFDIWSFLTVEIGITVDLHCLCLVIVTLSKITNHPPSIDLCQDLLCKLINNNEHLSALKSKKNSLYFGQIVSSYLNIGDIEGMWSFCEMIKKQTFGDILCVNQLSSSSMEMKERIIYGILLDIDLHTLITADLIGFYCVLFRFNPEQMIEGARHILAERQESGGIKTNVIARFELNGNEHVMENGNGQCKFNSVKLVDKIMEDIGYRIQVTSPAMELKEKRAHQKQLKCHAEKKALAVLLQSDDKQEIKIAVSMRMCMDCHHFFCSVSRHYGRDIVCVDPKGVHHFSDGFCSLCRE